MLNTSSHFGISFHTGGISIHQISSREELPDQVDDAAQGASQIDGQLRRPLKYAVPALLSITCFSIFLRLLPPTTMGFYIWGSDSGEYYKIIESIVEKGRVPVGYEGWGFAYPFFYGMEALAAALHVLTGIETLTILVFIIPTLAAFLVFPVFLIVRRIFVDVRIALLACLFITVSPTSVFTTSHPMPGAIGDMLGLLVIYAYLRMRSSKNSISSWCFMILAISGLMVTHHMSSYFVFISLTLYVTVRELLNRTHGTQLKRDIPILYFFLIFMIVYWLILVEPFRERIVDNVFGLSGWIITGIAIIGMTILFIFLRFRGHWQWQHQPHFPRIDDILKLITTAFVLLTLIMILIIFLGVPGTTIDVDGIVIILMAPLLILVILSASGPGFARFYEKGSFVFSWFVAIAISFIIMVATDNVVLLPYRHTQYILEPLLILSALGIVELYRFLVPVSGSSRKSFFKTGKVIVTIGIVLISMSIAYSAYPPREILGNFQEGTVYEEMQGVYWIREYGSDIKGEIASDHRMSSMIFGMGGVLASWDSAGKTLHAPDYEDASNEIKKEGISAVFMDNEIRKGAALLQWEDAKPIDEAALEKFNHPPFLRVLDSGFVQIYYIANITS